jgi:hypothetical protein
MAFAITIEHPALDSLPLGHAAQDFGASLERVLRRLASLNPCHVVGQAGIIEDADPIVITFRHPAITRVIRKAPQVPSRVPGPLYPSGQQCSSFASTVDCCAPIQTDGSWPSCGVPPQAIQDASDAFCHAQSCHDARHLPRRFSDAVVESLTAVPAPPPFARPHDAPRVIAPVVPLGSGDDEPCFDHDPWSLPIATKDQSHHHSGYPPPVPFASVSCPKTNVALLENRYTRIPITVPVPSPRSDNAPRAVSPRTQLGLGEDGSGAPSGLDSCLDGPKIHHGSCCHKTYHPPAQGVSFFPGLGEDGSCFPYGTDPCLDAAEARLNAAKDSSCIFKLKNAAEKPEKPFQSCRRSCILQADCCAPSLFVQPNGAPHVMLPSPPLGSGEDDTSAGLCGFGFCPSAATIQLQAPENPKMPASASNPSSSIKLKNADDQCCKSCCRFPVVPADCCRYVPLRPDKAGEGRNSVAKPQSQVPPSIPPLELGEDGSRALSGGAPSLDATKDSKEDVPVINASHRFKHAVIQLLQSCRFIPGPSTHVKEVPSNQFSGSAGGNTGLVKNDPRLFAQMTLDRVACSLSIVSALSGPTTPPSSLVLPCSTVMAPEGPISDQTAMLGLPRETAFDPSDECLTAHVKHGDDLILAQTVPGTAGIHRPSACVGSPVPSRNEHGRLLDQAVLPIVHGPLCSNVVAQSWSHALRHCIRSACLGARTRLIAAPDFLPSATRSPEDRAALIASDAHPAAIPWHAHDAMVLQPAALLAPEPAEVYPHSIRETIRAIASDQTTASPVPVSPCTEKGSMVCSKGPALGHAIHACPRGPALGHAIRSACHGARERLFATATADFLRRTTPRSAREVALIPSIACPTIHWPEHDPMALRTTASLARFPLQRTGVVYDPCDVPLNPVGSPSLGTRTRFTTAVPDHRKAVDQTGMALLLRPPQSDLVVCCQTEPRRYTTGFSRCSIRSRSCFCPGCFVAAHLLSASHCCGLLSGSSTGPRHLLCLC